jgi:DNA-3-methyladenine glycosylase
MTHMTHPIPRSAYLAPPDQVAPFLLGKLLVRRLGESTLIARIVETEAYFGLDDPAAHSFAGRTARTEVLFGPPGHAYVYLIYGMYSCLNVSCEPEGRAGCVLIRALEPVAGIGIMARNRKLPVTAKPASLTAGPGRLCQAFAITRAEHYGMDLTDPASNLQIHHNDISEDAGQTAEIALTPRINVNKAADRLLRYTLVGNPCLSRRP